MKNRAYFLFVLLLLSGEPSLARTIRSWTFQELFEQSQLVVIGVPMQTQDTQERADLPEIFGVTAGGTRVSVHAVGMESTLKVSVVLKGEAALKSIVVHHYRLLNTRQIDIDGPALASFEPAKGTAFLLFLVRERDGRYAPSSGQTDPAYFSILELTSLAK